MKHLFRDKNAKTHSGIWDNEIISTIFMVRDSLLIIFGLAILIDFLPFIKKALNDIGFNDILLTLGSLLIMIIAIMLYQRFKKSNHNTYAVPICSVSTDKTLVIYPESSRIFHIPHSEIKKIGYQVHQVRYIFLSITTHKALTYEIAIEEKQEDIQNLLTFIEKEMEIIPEEYKYT